MTPIGSLATLIWLHILARKGVRITWTYFMRIGIVLTLPTLATALLGLVLQLLLLHLNP
jgi:arsenical pump membrane protein